jgi:Heparinase II/III-like protein
VDPGTYVYLGLPAWREYFRGTRAHNTVCVDGADQSVQGGPFIWTRHATSRCLAFELGDDHDEFVGEHDGYRRLEDPLIHRRRVTRDGNRFLVNDQLVCRGSHRIERCWHFAETCAVTVRGTEIYAQSNGITVRIRAGSNNTLVRSLHGSETPIGGWLSRRFDRKVATTSVFFIDDIVGETTLDAEIDCFHRPRADERTHDAPAVTAAGAYYSGRRS